MKWCMFLFIFKTSCTVEFCTYLYRGFVIANFKKKNWKETLPDRIMWHQHFKKLLIFVGLSWSDFVSFPLNYVSHFYTITFTWHKYYHVFKGDKLAHNFATISIYDWYLCIFLFCKDEYAFKWCSKDFCSFIVACPLNTILITIL